MRKLIIVSVVVASVGLVLWLKPASSVPDSDTGAAAGTDQPTAGKTTVLLFADPREAGSACGCAEVIRLARSAVDVEGVDFREVDTRQPHEIATQYRVVVSPTVLILDPDGDVLHRFEGESRGAIEELQAAIDGLSEPSAEAD